MAPARVQASRTSWPPARNTTRRHASGRIACPTLVCAGRFDGIAPLANSEYLAREIPGAELAIFDGGHVFLLQDRTALPAMIAFLRRRDAGRSGPVDCPAWT